MLSLSGSAPIYGQCGINRKGKGIWDSATCNIAAYLRFTEEAGLMSQKHIRSISVCTLLCRYFTKICESQMLAEQLSYQDIPLLTGVLKEHT